MQHDLNVVGKNVAKFRRRRGWTQEELAARLQLLGWNVTSQFLAKIETGRCVVTGAQIVFFLRLHPKVGASWEGYAIEEVLKALRPSKRMWTRGPR